MKTRSKNFYFDITADNDGVTGSCFLVSIHYPCCDSTRRIVVDCGMTQGENLSFEEEYERNTKFHFNPESIESVFITHSHADHIGRLPLLMNKRYHGKINLTVNSSKSLKASLYNNFQISKRKAKMLKKEVPFSRENVEEVLNSLCLHPYQEKIDLGEGLSVTFFENGHLAGAACILIQATCEGFDDINLFFTGDYKAKNPFIKIPDLPTWLKELPITIVTESTYGNENSYDPGNEPNFERNLLNAINEGKEFIVPVCALERAQIAISKIKHLQDTGKLSPEIQVVIDGGLAIQHTMTYQNQMELSDEFTHNILPKNVIFVPRKKRSEYLSSFSPRIIIASGGMGSYGAAKIWIASRLSKKNAVIQFTCYLAKGTLGRMLYDASNLEEVKFNGEIIKKEAEIYFTSEFSAHAKADELIGLIKQFKNPQFVIVTHGESEVRDIFSLRVKKETKATIVFSITSMVFYRINSSGLVKPMATKF